MQTVLNGLISGLAIAVIALAFTIVYLPTRVFHVALGAVYACVPFVVWAGTRSGWPWYATVLLALLVGTLISILCEFLNHGRLEHKNASSSAHLVSSLGIYILLIQAISLTWGNDSKVLRIGLDSVFEFGDLILTGAQILSLVVSLFLLIGFYLWLRFTNLGLQFRGLADNPAEMALRGYNIRRLRLLAFAVSGFMGSGVSLIMAFDLGFDPYSGLHMLILAVVAMIIGGRQSFAGPVVGGVSLGVMRFGVVWYMSAQWQETSTFLLLGGFLLLRPRGIFGQKDRLEADS